ncbi:MAG TPA: thioredoxin domain-containing protein, partial [Chryseolinea sp.]|nr:thioredoxin domain-containing protein [Chryseolinea sp.]
MNKQHTNRLVHATSPYLLQHAHNPVDWYEWGAEALDKAKKDDKPLLVSIGYSSCHWCHVMERESFESPEIAKVMNDFFVCIKVDREERPDIDQIYMEAVQALGIHGGWPLNVFITPDQKPFFGGTYFTPQAWVQVLTNINRAFTANRQQLEETGEQLSVHLAHSDVSRFMKNEAATALIPDVKTMYAALEKHFDKEWGGMDRAPKFVMPSVWRFLLRYYHLTGDASALRHVQRTLDKVAEGGIYDQIRGGFARYAVDGYWFAPHFEKMLYDNGQLLSLYAEAYTVTKDESYKKIVYESFEWLTAEMTHPDGGFFSALDADSEGDEGKYYVWTQAELQDTLGSDADIISEYFQVTPGGNWEHGNNILNRKQRDEDFLKQKKIAQNDWQRILEAAKEKLLRR